MKLITIKFIEIFTDGTVNFSYVPLKSRKQVIFNEKDTKNFLFYRKSTTNQLVQTLFCTSYKSRYKL